MGELEPSSGLAEFNDQFKSMAKELMEKLESNDLQGAVTIIEEMHKKRDEGLFREVGQLTRALHESIKNFHVETDEGDDKEHSEMEAASDKLSYVVEMTSKAANKTMDVVEETMPISDKLLSEAQQLNDEWQKFLRKELSPAEFRELTQKIADFLQAAVENSQSINSNLSDILLAQDYQDLTGQVIMRVTTLVRDVEQRLVNLVAMAGHIDKMTGMSHDDLNKMASEGDTMKGVGPQVNKEVADVVSGQDDVDDLLSSLGF